MATTAAANPADQVPKPDDIPAYRDACQKQTDLENTCRKKAAECERLEALISPAQKGINPEVLLEASRLLGKSSAAQVARDRSQIVAEHNQLLFDLQALRLAIEQQHAIVAEAREAALRECQTRAAMIHRQFAKRFDEAMANFVALMREEAKFMNTIESRGVHCGGPLETIQFAWLGIYPDYDKYQHWRETLVAAGYLPETR
jgi:hypothetical protein